MTLLNNAKTKKTDVYINTIVNYAIYQKCSFTNIKVLHQFCSCRAVSDSNSVLDKTHCLAKLCKMNNIYLSVMKLQFCPATNSISLNTWALTLQLCQKHWSRTTPGPNLQPPVEDHPQELRLKLIKPVFINLSQYLTKQIFKNYYYSFFVVQITSVPATNIWNWNQNKLSKMWSINIQTQTL